jgi:hypothetical protein
MDPFVLSRIAALVEVNKKWVTEFLPIEVQVEVQVHEDEVQVVGEDEVQVGEGNVQVGDSDCTAWDLIQRGISYSTVSHDLVQRGISYSMGSHSSTARDLVQHGISFTAMLYYDIVLVPCCMRPHTVEIPYFTRSTVECFGQMFRLLTISLRKSTVTS